MMYVLEELMLQSHNMQKWKVMPSLGALPTMKAT